MEPILLMADRRNLPHHQPEAEPVLVTVDGDQVRLELDDGQTLAFNTVELAVALTVPLAGLRRAA